MQTPTFLSAEWRHLVMLNFTVDHAVLEPLVPPGTELDYFRGQAFVSLVGFLFLRTRVFGISFPFHRSFEEVNLRFYVRRKSEEGWRRGVVFVRELVPRRTIAFFARTFYGEPYSAFPMRHSVDLSASSIRVEYAWCRESRWETLYAIGMGQPQEISDGSEEEFIAEHYWGYTGRKTGTSEYQVEHSRWRIWQSVDAGFEADVSTLYGSRFVEGLSAPPVSAFIADGSPVTVRFSATLARG